MIDYCRSCGDDYLDSILDLGEQYLSDFRDDDELPPKHRLNLLKCRTCHLVQLDETTPSYEMYHERYGFKSGINEAIKADLKDIVDYTLAWKPDPSNWLDIACNDGTLLSFVPQSVRRSGIDPIEKYAREALTKSDEIISDFFKPTYFNEKEFDVITSISMFYDLDDPNEFVAGVKSVLAEDGVWVIQQNYLHTMMEINAYDNICHEHLTYFSLISLRPLLERHGLEINDVQLSDVNGGCVRTLVSRRGKHEVKPSVAFRMGNEYRAGLDDIWAYEDFRDKVIKSVDETRQFILKAVGTGKTVFLYGASTRGGTIWQAVGLGPSLTPFAVERNPEKFGKKIASIGVPIISEEEARMMRPDYMLVSPWFFRDVFVEREAPYINGGGALVFPLPEFEVVSK